MSNAPTTNPSTQLPQTLSITVIKPKDKTFGIGFGQEDGTHNIIITSITESSLFSNTALKVGHIVHSINRKKYTSFEEGTQILKGFAEGELTVEVSQRSTSHQTPPSAAINTTTNTTISRTQLNTSSRISTDAPSIIHKPRVQYPPQQQYFRHSSTYYNYPIPSIYGYPLSYPPQPNLYAYPPNQYYPPLPNQYGNRILKKSHILRHIKEI